LWRGLPACENGRQDAYPTRQAGCLPYKAAKMGALQGYGTTAVQAEVLPDSNPSAKIAT
jgi:hypothetical protein